MIALYDVNMLIALHDGNHVRHRAAFDWHREHGGDGWASCAITQSGFVRIMSNPKYANPQPIFALLDAVSKFSASKEHTFWSDALTLGAADVFNRTYAFTSSRLTDAYLLALAVKNKGRLVTLDQHISVDAVIGASKRSLVVL